MIKFENVNKVWPNGKYALENINLEIKTGEFVAIVGLSGAGKTTLLKTINKFVPISSGAIQINFDNEQFDVNKIKGKELKNLRKHIGLMSQEYNNIEKQVVLKNVLNSRVSKMGFLRALIGYFNKQDKFIALQNLEKLNLLDYAYVRAENLSGGQQQRIALARTLAQEPSLIIADEPVSALDPVLANQVMQDFQRINSEDKITIIINIHHIDLALKYATRIIGLKDGKILFAGDPAELSTTRLEQIYGKEYSKN
ncbi:phosphonate transport system ATP-binding protein [Spiroplasma clarkii]|uniref:Phosphonate transport system ATP-binding protein n=1 Tax=Spiroplasma clarkii TaxID=2139 RepID=A0A1Y0L070_9MOLU|nr:phosphonate ABC transporter ATP-binding protein [Spiroplasma clarkii]ARU91108.1 phosphonate transport system ATP-binding protein [Spiroplasma clarkii]ATX70551.1 phosphonate transport system ATP-binding protein [Spiroplasma clarkii]